MSIDRMDINYVLNSAEPDTNSINEEQAPFESSTNRSHQSDGVTQSSLEPVISRHPLSKDMSCPGYEALCFCPWCPDRWFGDDEIDSHIVGHLQEVDQAIWAGDGKDHSITLTKMVAHVMMCVEHAPPYCCTYQDGSPCGAFPKPKDLMDHIYNAHCPRAFKCPWHPCEGPNSVHFSYNGLKEHVRKCHIFPVWYMCRYCHMVVRNRVGLVAHRWHRRHLEVECDLEKMLNSHN